jgi:hypothetical protein
MSEIDTLVERAKDVREKDEDELTRLDELDEDTEL